MKPAPKRAIIIADQSVTNGASVTGTVDTLGYDFITVDVFQTTSNNATNKLATCKISESDDTNATNFSDVAALVGGGAGGFVVPAADVANNQLYGFNLDLKKRKRYLKLTLSPVTTQSLHATAQLHIAEQEPTQAADAGVVLLVNL